jgi:hypothetical protein
MSVTAGLTPETLTFDEIKRWSAQEMKDQMRRSDEMRKKVYEVVRAQSLSDIESAQQQIDTNPTTTLTVEAQEETPVPDQQAEAEKLAADAREAEKQKAIKEENDQLAAAGISVVRDQYGNIAKLIQDYQATDENGAAIGRPTHLEARSWPEMAMKQREAHTQAVRWGHRLKQQKVSFRETVPQAQQNLSDADLLETMKDLKSDDPQKQLAAIRKVQKSESDKIEAQRLETERQASVSRRFLARHKEDFYNCEANIKEVRDYFVENPDLTWTDDNLEICFLAVEHKLAAFPTPEPKAELTPQVTPVVVQAVQPVQATPVQAAVVTNTQTVVQRPGVNGGVVPGESSATRPGPTKARKLTAEEVKSWSYEQMKKYNRDPVMRPLIEEFVRERNQRAKR